MRLLSILLLLVISAVTSLSQGIEFFHGSWEQALEEAKKQDKIIFVDAYAAWCGPCKRMAAQVFPQAKVGEFFNRHFINVKLDYEKEEAKTFRQKYPVSAFPTLFFIDFDGTVVHKAVGGQQVDGLIKLGEFAKSKIDRSGNYEEAYIKGDRSPELVFNYIRALNQAGKPSLKIANDYLQGQKDHALPENLKIIFVGTTEADSRLFDWLIKYRNEIGKIFPPESIDEQIESACKKTAQKAIEFQSYSLLLEAQDKMKKHLPDHADKFMIETDMAYHKNMGNPEDYLKACKAFVKIEKDEAVTLLRLSQEMKTAFPLDEKIQKEAEKLEEKAKKGHKTDSFRTTN